MSFEMFGLRLQKIFTPSESFIIVGTKRFSTGTAVKLKTWAQEVKITAVKNDSEIIDAFFNLYFMRFILKNILAQN